MNKRVAALLVLSCYALSSPSFADDDPFASPESPRLARPRGLEAAARALRSSAIVGDTTYVGYTPGRFDAARNWWSIGAGYSSASSNSPAYKRPYAGQGGMWDFEPTGGSYLHGDSLQGWWPDRQLVTGTGGQTRSDWGRPWWAFETGNNANYVLPGSTRTYGVVGVWHRDDAGAPSDGGPNGPTWAPIGGGFSAWMGLRRHGDQRFVDPITHNAFNADVMAFTAYGAASTSGSDNAFPGYGSQMDQLLYRDIDMAGHTERDLTISYQYRLRMSTGFGSAAATRTGWFDKDPLAVSGGGATNIAPGNFISSTDAGNAGAPRDSFTVYVGAPVGAVFLASTGATMTVYDPQRRWFDEVIRANEAGLWKQIDRDTGSVGLATKSITIPNAVLAPILATSAGGENRLVRLVFRVHTNRGFDDQGAAYSSGGAGAAVLDNVTYQMVGGPSSPAGWGDFESASSIDNGLGFDAMQAWKSTGKPPQTFAHVHALASLQYDDLCGQPGDVSRQCNLDGVVLSLGDHDHSEAASGLVDGKMDRELWIGGWSPTIQLRSDDGAWPNPIGLRDPALGGVQDGHASGDYFLDYDLYAGVFDPFNKGVLWRFGFMSYPAADRNGNATWGNPRTPPYILFNPDQVCLRQLLDDPIRSNGMLQWSAGLSENTTFPDSVRFMIGHRTECYRFGVSSGCAPTDGSYWDNLSLTIVDGTPQPVSAQIWNLFQDTFPANETAGLPAFAVRFDTTTALVKSGLNIAPTTLNLNRFDVPGDSAVVTVTGDVVRIDLVFRVLPGPGNYVTVGRPDLSTLRKLPNSNAPIVAGDLTNFWSSYMANNGPYGTPGGHGPSWNGNVWNSARCDTAESGIFPVHARLVGLPPGPTLFRTTYHESELGIAPLPTAGDPYPVVSTRAGLGVSRHRCYLASASASTTDIDCVHDAPAIGAGYDLSYLAAPGAGWDGTNITVEGTKILPDGLFTPGTHVQYFFRSTVDGGTFAGMMPDTNVVFPQLGEGSLDAHRWQGFSVLPDRWKDPSYRHPVFNQFGTGNACMLVVDNNDRRGDEAVWAGIADTLGATSPIKRGAHNGWHAPGTGAAAVNAPSSFVRVHGGSPGTTWDFYQVKASESLTSGAGSIGSRLSFRDPANTQINGKTSRQGPTPEMMSAFYKIVFLFSGDLNSGIMGPFRDKSSNDVHILEDWLAEGNLSALDVDRGFWAMGNGFVESNFFEGNDQEQFLTDVLGVALRNNSYILESGNTELVPDLLPTPGGPLYPYNDTWGIQSTCVWTNDILERTASLLSQTTDNAKYENAGPGPFPLLASVYKSHAAAQPWISVVDGFDMVNLRSRFDTDAKGRLRYFNEVAVATLAAICPIVIYPPCGGVFGDGVECTGVGDRAGVPDYLALANNPVRSGPAIVSFGLAAADRVEARVFDVAGRMVRRLADRRFPAGEHRLVWDGYDDGGQRLPRGVYFTRIRFVERGFEDAKKLTMLR